MKVFRAFLGVVTLSLLASVGAATNGGPVEVVESASDAMLAALDGKRDYYRENPDEIYPVMQEFMESGFQLRDEEFVIVNVMNNRGGSSLFPQTFISNLNGAVNWDTYWGELSSPPIVAYFAGYDLKSKAAQSPGFRQVIEKNRKLVDSYQSSPMKKWVCSSTTNRAQAGNFKGTPCLNPLASR